MKDDPKPDYSGIVIFLLALLSVLIHLIVSDNLEYHRDELLYFSLGLHPAAGYATVPPMIGWIAALMQNIFGYTVFAVRLFPAVMSGLMVFLVAGIAREMGGSGYARILAATGFLIAVFALRAFNLFQPVHTDILFWTLIFYLVLRYINTSSDNYLVLLGITAGAGLLNKYLLGLLLLALLVVVPITQYRNIFVRRKFWFGLLAWFIVFLPNLIWQFVNGLPVISHMAELERTQLVNVDRSAFLSEQLVFPGMASVLTVAGLIWLFLGRKAWRYRFLGTTVVIVIAALMLMRGKSYYTMGVFPFLIAAGAVSWEMTLKKTFSRITLILLLVLLTIPSLPIGIPLFGQDKLASYFGKLSNDYGMDFLCRFEDGSIHPLPQDYADMLGWEELTGIAAKAWDMIEDKNTAFIYCENYGYAGAVTIIGKKFGLPEAVSFNESFRYWIPLVFNPDITSAVYINSEIGDDVGQIFGKITKVGSISNPLSREYGTSVWLLEEPTGSFNSFWLDRVKQFF